MAKSKLERHFLWPDTHYPYECKKSVNVAIKACEALEPDGVHLLGDFGDFYCTSRHPKDPNRIRDLKVEVEACNAGLDRIDALKIKQKTFCAGNHEYNLERYLMERAPELFNMVKVEELFHLKKRGYRYVAYRDYTKVGKLHLTHENGYAGGQAHVQTGRDFGANVVIGHTHRLAVSYSSTMLGDAHVSGMLGWLGDKKQAEYMYKAKTKDWQTGFGLAYLEPSGTAHVQPVPIINGKCMIEGQLIS